MSVFFCKMEWEIREIFLSKSKENSFSSFHRQIRGPVVVCSTSDWTQGIIHARVDFLSQLWNYFEMKHNLPCWCTSQRILLQRTEVPKFWQVLPLHGVLLACLHTLANQFLNTIKIFKYTGNLKALYWGIYIASPYRCFNDICSITHSSILFLKFMCI